jgi:hypothetical protein
MAAADAIAREFSTALNGFGIDIVHPLQLDWCADCRVPCSLGGGGSFLSFSSPPFEEEY